MAMEADEEFDSRNSMQGTGGTSSIRPSSSNLLKHLTALKRKGKLSAMQPLDKRKKSAASTSASKGKAVNKVVEALHSSRSKDKSTKQRGSNKGAYVFKKL